MRPPRKAMVLAAGLGSRLAPLTLDIPKPLLPFRGSPLLARLLRQLAAWGVEEVLLNAHHLAEKVVEETPALAPPGMKLAFSHEPVILGTGGALRRMAWFFDDTPLWVCNADVVMNLNPAPLLKTFARTKPLAALWMVPDRGPRTVRVARDAVVDFRSGGMTFSGLHLTHRGILAHLPGEERFCSLVDAWEAAMRSGERIAAVTVPGSEWADIGTPEQWLEAEGGNVVFPGARVDAGAKLEGAIVGNGVRARRGRRFRGLVVSPAQGLSALEQGWLPDAEAVEVLPARGSDRSFLRVASPKGSHVIMRRGDARPENARYTANTRFLEKHGVRVARILKESPDGRTWLLEDLGRVHLRDRPTPANTRKALELTARLHGAGGWRRLSLEPAFGPELYQWEHALFFNEFLARHDPAADPRPLRAALEQAAERLMREPSTLVHRDLQSTNFLFHQGEAALIDYQGMREGPAAYDLASLLADPYLARPFSAQLALLDTYNLIAKRPVKPEVYRAACLQRLGQTLGAFGRLGALPGTRRFLQHIPAAARQWEAVAGDPEARAWARGFLERQTPENPLQGQA